MTALNSALLFNSTSGSDTTASGSSAGANVYGSGASTASASAVVTGITTTGVQAGDLLWVQSSSGRQFSVIASVDSGTQVTCDDTFANTESSRTWAIGGKRATLDSSVELFEYNYNTGKSYDVELQTDQTLTQPFNGSGGRGITINVYSDDPTTRRSVTTSAQYMFMGGAIKLRDLELYSTYSGNASVFFASTGSTVQAVFANIHNCILGNQTNPWYTVGSQSAAYVYFEANQCVFQNFSWNVIYRLQSQVMNSLFRNNDAYIYATSTFDTGTYSPYFVGCLMHDNAEGFYFQSGFGGMIVGNVVHNCATSQPAVAIGRTDMTAKTIQKNIFSSCSNSPRTDCNWVARQNAYYNSGWSGFDDELDPITLTADPFVDAANGDFNLNADSGGGATLRANNFAINTDTSVYPFRQYVSDDFDSGAGSSATIHPLYAN